MQPLAIDPVAWTVQEQIDRVLAGDVGFIAPLHKIAPELPAPLYSQHAIYRLVRLSRHLIRLYLVDDYAPDQEAEVDKRLAQLLDAMDSQ